MSDSFQCPCCGATSYNHHDIQEGYCGRCHWWTGHPVLGDPGFWPDNFGPEDE